MWSTRTYLKKCSELKQAGFNPLFEKGARVGRGFADLGVEEFLMLSDRQTLSLFTGQKAELADEHRHFFFLIPSATQTVNLIQKTGWNVLNMSFAEQRKWRVDVENCADASRFSFEARDIEEALLDAFLFIWRTGHVQSV